MTNILHMFSDGETLFSRSKVTKSSATPHQVVSQHICHPWARHVGWSRNQFRAKRYHDCSSATPNPLDCGRPTRLLEQCPSTIATPSPILFESAQSSSGGVGFASALPLQFCEVDRGLSHDWSRACYACRCPDSDKTPW